MYLNLMKIDTKHRSFRIAYYRLCFSFLIPQVSSYSFSSATVTQRLLQRVKCNNQSANATTIPFLVENKTVGNVLPQVARILTKYRSTFEMTPHGLVLLDPKEVNIDGHDGPSLDFASQDSNQEDIIERRSRSVDHVLREIRSQNLIPALNGWRDEAFAVRESFHAKPSLILERAASVLFGVPAYGVFLNAYTCEEKNDETGSDTTEFYHLQSDSVTHKQHRPTHLWIGRRSSTKATWPGRLDCLAAGGLAAGMLPREAMQKECSEEAGLYHVTPRPVSVVSYTGYNEDRWGIKRDVLFCFDVELSKHFTPISVDGEMDSFQKFPISSVIEMLTEPVLPDDSNNIWKPNVGVVIIDFLVRHGFVDVNDVSFLDLVESLRGAKCS
jgi:8-oxo-dGTP pyrophosphatase MutT (NUDIX family)